MSPRIDRKVTEVSGEERDSLYARAARRRRVFALRLLGAFVAALGLIGAAQYVLEARAIRGQLLEDRSASFEAEARHMEKHLAEDGLTEAGLEAVADGMKHIQLRPGMQSVALVDATGTVLAAGDPSQVGTVRRSPAISGAVGTGAVHSGIEPSPSGNVFEYVGPVVSSEGLIAFEAVADARVLDAFISELRQTILVNLLIGLTLGLPFFYLLGARHLSVRYGAVELTQEERKVALDHTVSAAERERSRLAAELHDGPIQRLSAIGYALERAKVRLDRDDRGGASELIASISGDLGGEVGGLRRMMTDLRPPALDERGLQAAVLDSVNEFARRSGVRTSADLAVPRRLSTSVETVIYRVVQEALTNVGKHSRARSAQVRMAVSNGSIEVEVSDDGVGFDVERQRQTRHQAHFGLAVMRERVEIVGGRWIVRAAPGSGTTVRADIPVEASPA